MCVKFCFQIRTKIKRKGCCDTPNVTIATTVYSMVLHHLIAVNQWQANLV
jgi:hypothetical protein